MTHVDIIEMADGQSYQITEAQEMDERFCALSCLLDAGATIAFPDHGVEAYQILGEGPWDKKDRVVNMWHEYMALDGDDA